MNRQIVGERLDAPETLPLIMMCVQSGYAEGGSRPSPTMPMAKKQHLAVLLFCSFIINLFFIYIQVTHCSKSPAMI